MNVVVQDNRPNAIGEDEWAVRLDLAAAYRLVDHFGMSQLVFNHITAKVPGPEKHFLINEYGLSYDEITASNLVKVDLDGTVVDGTDREINPAGYVIHSCVHRALDDVACVLHTHSEAGVAVSCLKDGFVPMEQTGFFFVDRIAYHDYEGLAVDEDEQARLVADLGDKRVIMLRNHGILTCGRSVAEAFRMMYFLETACRTQLAVMKTGREINRPADGVAAHTAAQFASGAAATETAGTPREWPALLRMLDRKDPSWRS